MPKNNAKLTLILLFVTFLFGVGMSIPCILEYSLQKLLFLIAGWAPFVINALICIFDPLIVFHRHNFYIAVDHQYTLLNENIFENAIVLKKKKIIKYKKDLNDRLVESTYKVMKNPKLGLKFKVYELANGLQLVDLNSHSYSKMANGYKELGSKAYVNDHEKNINLLCMKIAPQDNTKGPYIGKYVSDNKRVVLLIKEITPQDDSKAYAYKVERYNCATAYECQKIKDVIKSMAPHYIPDFFDWHDGAFTTNSLKEAKEHAIKVIKDINEANR